MRAIILTTSLALACGLALAQSQQGGPSSDGYVVQGGKVMMTKGGKTTAMDSDTTLSDGTKIMKDGTVVRKDGSKSMMKDGERMDMSGAMRK
jgi:uncharacterized protein YdeI (BOF family)